jgi:ABC-type multidrug transport system ATPase subunit
MDEIEQVADEITVIDGGKIVLQDSKEALLRLADAVLISVEPMTESAVGVLRQRGGLRAEADSVHVERDERFSENMAAVFAVLHDHGVRVKDVVFGHRNLEELFLKLTSSRLRDGEGRNGQA